MTNASETNEPWNLPRQSSQQPEQKCPLKKERRKPYRRSLLTTNREAAGRPSEGSGGTTFNLRRSEKNWHVE